MMLGKLPYAHDTRTLRLARYLTATHAPAVVDWTAAIANTPTPLYENDTLSDCVCAALAHQITVWSANGQAHACVLPERNVVDAYFALTGGEDTGLVLLDTLKRYRRAGFCEHRIAAFASVDPADDVHVRLALYLFGGLVVGLELPRSAQDQRVWEVTHGVDAAVGSWGGHAVNIVRATADELECITWGERKRMSRDFFARYCSEAWVALSPDFLTALRAPNGLDVDELARDLASL